ncbi:MAG: hypothetical protein NUV73_02165 [Candidatus Daviesbacteria bacterium]|nr:hypothetical protein [Candidatus Daviesbacteria bacterium]
MPETKDHIPTIAETMVANIAKHSSTLNLDTYQEQPMPSITKGEECVPSFLKALRVSGFTNLATVLAVAHHGEHRIRQGKNFLNEEESQNFHAYWKIIKDLSSVVSDNAPLLDKKAPVDIVREYRQGSGTTNMQIVLTFYERYLDRVLGTSAMIRPANWRAESLLEIGKKNGFVISPLMEACLPAKESQKVAV